jgi:hypothetical protein
VAQLGRWSHDAGRRSRALLAVLDEQARPLVRQAAADEIFARRRPVLMVVDQGSLCWVSGRLATRRDGAAWAEELARLPALEQLTKDAGTGLAGGLARVNARRRAAGLRAVAEQDDHFHVLREGQAALRQGAAAARRALARAEKAEKKEWRRQRGPRAGPRTGHASAVALRWRQAERAFDAWAAEECAWGRVTAALARWGADGQLPTRAQAEAAEAAALPGLPGPRWAKVRRSLARPQLWAYLDEAHQRLAALPVAPELRDAALQVAGARRRPEALAGAGARSAALRAVVLASSLVLSLAGAAGAEALARVRGVLSGVWRASSLVEGVNSVLRMQQARHRRLTQGLLDLKRLYWNVRRFGTGKRRGQSPYEHLGLTLPPLPWWQLLKLSPQELCHQLSAQEVVA